MENTLATTDPPKGEGECMLTLLPDEILKDIIIYMVDVLRREGLNGYLGIKPIINGELMYHEIYMPHQYRLDSIVCINSFLRAFGIIRTLCKRIGDVASKTNTRQIVYVSYYLANASPLLTLLNPICHAMVDFGYVNDEEADTLCLWDAQSTYENLHSSISLESIKVVKSWIYQNEGKIFKHFCEPKSKSFIQMHKNRDERLAYEYPHVGAYVRSKIYKVYEFSLFPKKDAVAGLYSDGFFLAIVCLMQEKFARKCREIYIDSFYYTMMLSCWNLSDFRVTKLGISFRSNYTDYENPVNLDLAPLKTLKELELLQFSNLTIESLPRSLKKVKLTLEINTELAKANFEVMVRDLDTRNLCLDINSEEMSYEPDFPKMHVKKLIVSGREKKSFFETERQYRKLFDFKGITADYITVDMTTSIIETDLRNVKKFVMVNDFPLYPIREIKENTDRIPKVTIFNSQVLSPRAWSKIAAYCLCNGIPCDIIYTQERVAQIIASFE
jgi:hypothetical protein